MEGQNGRLNFVVIIRGPLKSHRETLGASVLLLISNYSHISELPATGRLPGEMCPKYWEMFGCKSVFVMSKSVREDLL